MLVNDQKVSSSLDEYQNRDEVVPTLDRDPKVLVVDELMEAPLSLDTRKITLEPMGLEYGSRCSVVNQGMYSETVYDVCENDTNNGWWSIMTDQVIYFQQQVKPDIEFSEATPLEKEKDYIHSVKQRKEVKQGEDKSKLLDSKTLYFNAAYKNRPTVYGEMDQRYDEVTVNLSNTFDPDKNITTTYLWPDSNGAKQEPIIEQSNDSWFPTGKFPMTVKGEVEGELMDDTPIRVKVLIDSGATKPIMNRKYYEKTPFLKTYPTHKIKKRRIIVANGKTIEVDTCIDVIIRLGGHMFEITAYLMDMCDEFDFIIGQKAMYELEGGPDFGELAFHFKMRSVPVYPCEDIHIKPGESKTFLARMLSRPKSFKKGKAILKVKNPAPSTHMDEITTQTLLVEVKEGKMKLTAKNESAQDFILKSNHIFGCIDLRSAGYFHISRLTLEESLKDKCSFLSEQDTKEYFCQLIKDHKELVGKMEEMENTKLVQSKEVLRDEKSKELVKEKDPYPWLDEDDPRRTMTDQEIIEKYVDLSESDLTDREKKTLYRVIMKYKKAFSLRDEIGTCPHMEIELELTDKTPFYIRPFPIKEAEKDIVDKQMRKGCLLGILRKGMSSYSSPIMLIPRKQGGIPRIVTDFRHLNSRLVTLQPSIPLVRDAIQILGASGCEVVSVLDLRDAYHTLRLAKDSQKYCGITPYYGSDTYLYQRLGMGLSVSPAVWQNFIQRVLSEIPNHRKHHLAIMDDCLIYSKKNDHMEHLIDLFKALIRNGLKISPKKCQLFRKKLTYMGHTLLIEDGIPKITPLKSRVDAILKLDPPKTPKNCKSFCGMVNYLSIFLKDLQTKLIPIYQLTRKGIPFVWTEECQLAFDDIKQALTNPPVLVMPNETGHFVLVSDTSTTGCGAALYQEQKGRYRLVAYYSKKLPDAVKRYSISELELTGVLANVSAFKHILRNANFTVYCDHSALVHIIQAKREPPTLRLKKLLEHLSDYRFGIKFLKGKEMHISDFLSRHTDNDEDSPNEIIPISFMATDLLISFRDSEQWYKGNNKDAMMVIVGHECSVCAAMSESKPKECVSVITRSMVKKADVTPPPMYPLRGDHKQPEKSQSGIINLPQTDKNKNIEQAAANLRIPRAGVEKLEPDVGSNIVPTDVGIVQPQPDPLPVLHKREFTKSNPIDKYRYDRVVNPLPIDVRLQGRLPAYDVETELMSNKPIDTIQEFKKMKSQKLLEKIKDNSIIRRHVPKQVELDKFIESLKHKVIHDYHLPISVKELRAEYSNSPYFKDIYKYLVKGVCGFIGKAQRLFKLQCEDYIIMEGVLFKIRYIGKDILDVVLCVPENYIPMVLHQYHDTLLSGHPGVTKLYETIRKRYYFPAMYTVIRQYVVSCIECQSMKDKTHGVNIHYPRIPLDYRPMSRFSMDVKHMPPSKLGYNKILVCTCEATNWVVAIPICDEKASTLAEAIYFKIVCIYGTPKAVICDESPAFTSELMRSYWHALNIRPFYISPMNHGSNRTERYIRTMNDIICKHLSGKGDDWPLYVQPTCYAMNTQVSLVTGFSPYEMVFIQQPPDLMNFDFDPDRSGLKVNTQQYMEVMAKRQKQMKGIIKERKELEAKTQQIREMRRNPDYKGFAMGDLVFLYHGPGSVLQAPARKLKKNWIGPLRIQGILDDSHYLISDWQGKLLPQKVHVNRLKPCTINLGGISEDGMLEVVSNTRELFSKWKEIIDKSVVLD